MRRAMYQYDGFGSDEKKQQNIFSADKARQLENMMGMRGNRV